MQKEKKDRKGGGGGEMMGGRGRKVMGVRRRVKEREKIWKRIGGEK